MQNVKIVLATLDGKIVQLPSGNYALVNLKCQYTNCAGKSSNIPYWDIIDAYEAEKRGEKIYFLPSGHFSEPYGIDNIKEGEIPRRYKKFVDDLLQKEQEGKLQILSQNYVDRERKRIAQDKFRRAREEALYYYERVLQKQTPAGMQLEQVDSALSRVDKSGYNTRLQKLYDKKGRLTSGHPKPVLKDELRKLEDWEHLRAALKREVKHLKKLVGAEKTKWIKKWEEDYWKDYYSSQ